MADRLIRIASYPDAASAYVARNELEAAGIKVALENEHSVNALGLASGANVRLLVNEKSEPEAREILAKLEAEEESSDNS